jgi:hypothetical protein
MTNRVIMLIECPQGKVPFRIRIRSNRIQPVNLASGVR